MSPDPHLPLRADVNLLGTLLGEALQQIEGRDVYDAVECVRALAKKARDGDAADLEAMEQTLTQLPVESALTVARAFAHFLTLANIAEQHHRIRRRRTSRTPWGSKRRTAARRSDQRKRKVVEAKVVSEVRRQGIDP